MAPGGDTSRTLEIAGRTLVAGVLSTVASSSGAPDYAFYQGTSMAAPHGAGLVALMLADDPDLTPAQVTVRLRDSARELDAAACDRPTTSLRIAYDLTELDPGTYLVAAWQDLDQDLVVDEGEPFGVHPDLVPIAAGEVRTGITVHMERFTVSATEFQSVAIAGLQRRPSARGR